MPIETQYKANDDGSTSGQNVIAETFADYGDGLWGFHAQGIDSGHGVVGYFRIDSTAAPVATATTTAQPGATATATSAPDSGGSTSDNQRATLCLETEPEPTEGAVAWMVDPRPRQNTRATVCARLIVNGERRALEDVLVDVQYSGGTVRYEGSTGAQGIVLFSFNILNAPVNQPVNVLAIFINAGAQASTSFVPQP
ncbi:MAG: hypothetical protein HC837_21310 [Chloroflexaceae bacterium]|nr:hypothetical protein [Chloroflexaceae bacterium]